MNRRVRRIAGTCRRRLVLGLLVLAVGAAAVHAQEVLTNDSIVMMVKAGLAESVILLKIRSTATKFDVRTEALVALKQAGVADKILETMLTATVSASGTGGGTAAATAAGPPRPAAEPPTPSAVPTPPATTGRPSGHDAVYHFIGTRYVEMAAVIASVETRSRFVGGRTELVLAKSGAEYRITERQPVFYSVYPAGEARLVRLTPGDAERSLVIGSVGFFALGTTPQLGVRAEDRIEVTAEREGSFFRVVPSSPLEPGEYGFVIGSVAPGRTNKIYDFGVE